jgi:hypothetical protein
MGRLSQLGDPWWHDSGPWILCSLRPCLVQAVLEDHWIDFPLNRLIGSSLPKQMISIKFMWNPLNMNFAYCPFGISDLKDINFKRCDLKV